MPQFQKLEGKIEDISCKDLVDLNADLYFLILQKLKEKAIELEKLIDKKSRNEDGGTGNEFQILEKDLIKERLLGFSLKIHLYHIRVSKIHSCLIRANIY